MISSPLFSGMDSDRVHVEARKDTGHEQSVAVGGEGHAHYRLVEGRNGNLVLGGIQPDFYVTVIICRGQLVSILL